MISAQKHGPSVKTTNVTNVRMTDQTAEEKLERMKELARQRQRKAYKKKRTLETVAEDTDSDEEEVCQMQPAKRRREVRRDERRDDMIIDYSEIKHAVEKCLEEREKKEKEAKANPVAGYAMAAVGLAGIVSSALNCLPANIRNGMFNKPLGFLSTAAVTAPPIGPTVEILPVSLQSALQTLPSSVQSLLKC